jgi:dihydropyrimidinase
MNIIIKNGTLITATDTFEADILIEGERIKTIGQGLNGADSKIIDAAGKLVMPGCVDPHTHFDLPMFNTVSSDDHYTGHKAAAFGGTTTVMDFVPHIVSQPSGRGDLINSVREWRQKADPKAAVDYGFHMNITHFDESVANEIPELLNVGITSLKVFTAYNNRLRIQDGDIFKSMRIAMEYGFLTLLHAENGDVIDVLVSEALAAGNTSPIWHARTRPAWGAVEAAMRGFALAAETGAPLYLVHMNVAGEVDMLRYARENGVPVLGETCPQYLFFTETALSKDDGAKWVCSPPLRTTTDNNRLWEGVKDGSIHVVATDHCPFYYDGTTPINYEGVNIAIAGKELGDTNFTLIPNGLPGVGDRLPVMWTEGVVKGRISPNQFVALMSTNPAKIFGIYPRKGCLMPGSDADILIWDPNLMVQYGASVSHHRTDYNLFEGWELTGYPEKVFLRGTLIVDGNEWLGNAGMGHFLNRSPGVDINSFV